MNTEQERAELLPCPFCGGEPSITKQMGESLWSHDIVLWTQVQCDGCEAHVGPTCEGFEVEAVDIWNRRAALQSQDREDAARWRYMRRKLCLTGNGNGTCAMQAINLPEAIKGWPEPGQVADFCDAAIDHARRIEGKKNETL